MSRIRLVCSSSMQLAILFSAMIIVGLLLVNHGYLLSSPAINSCIFDYQIKVTIGILGVLAVALFTTSHYITKRINRIVATANNIVRTGDLSQRIPIETEWDDLSKLSITLNSMLDEIEKSVSSIRTASNNIAHDLRHPLTRMRNRIEDFRVVPPTTLEGYDATMQSLIQECDGLLATFNALLRIASAESGKRAGKATELSLTTLLTDVTELYEPLAAEKSVGFDVELHPVTLVGDKDLLFQLFANLCDNAVKYTPQGGNVRVRLSQLKEGALIEISDSGPGIPEEEMDKVFQRFYRIAPCRSTPGNGLGLSLVQAIIRMHQGCIKLANLTPSGLYVRIVLPN